MFGQPGMSPVVLPDLWTWDSSSQAGKTSQDVLSCPRTSWNFGPMLSQYGTLVVMPGRISRDVPSCPRTFWDDHGLCGSQIWWN